MTRLPFTFDATDDRYFVRDAEPGEYEFLTVEEMLPLFGRIADLVTPGLALVSEPDA